MRVTIWANSFLKFNTCSIKFCFPLWTIKYNFFEKYFSIILKILIHKYRVIIWHTTRFLKLDLFSFFSLRQSFFISSIIYGSSSHLRSAQCNVRKYVDISNCLIISSTWNKNWYSFGYTHKWKWVVTCNKPFSCSFKII